MTPLPQRVPFRAAPFFGRAELGRFFDSRHLFGCGVEVGTHRGDFACVLREGWHGRDMVCVDPWTVPPGYEFQASLLWDSHSRDDDFAEFQRRAAAAPRPLRALRLTSLEAAVLFNTAEVGWVYLDGDHRYEEVAVDLRVWWAKLQPGGILAGHDIVCPPGPPEHDWGRDVWRAVEEFAQAQGLTVYLIPEHNPAESWSFFLEKPR